MNPLLQMFDQINSGINDIKKRLDDICRSRTDEFKQTWIDGQDVMIALKISKRTLQTLRDSKQMPYSRINGKFYYKIQDLEKLLESNYTRNHQKWQP